MGLLRKKLLNGEREVGVWGTGYIGFSTMANFATNGVICLGTDIDESTVNAINAGRIPIPNMEYWLGLRQLACQIQNDARHDQLERAHKREDCCSHDSCSTERNDKPWDDALIDVVGKIAAIHEANIREAPLVIVESTLAPNKTNEIITPSSNRKDSESEKTST